MASWVGSIPSSSDPLIRIRPASRGNKNGVTSGYAVLPLLNVGEMTLRLYAALNYSQNSAHDLRRKLNGA